MAREGASGQPKKGVSPARNVIGVILLVLFAGAAIIEFKANQSHASAIATLQAMRVKDDKGQVSEDPTFTGGKRPTQADVERAIGMGGSPAKLVDADIEQYAAYNWRGLFRAYQLKVYYTKDKPPGLVRVETE